MHRNKKKTDSVGVCISNNNKEKVAINFRMCGYGRSLREDSLEELEGGKAGEKECNLFQLKTFTKEIL